MLLVDSNLLRFSAQHDPILEPKLASISLSFALLFTITFPTQFPTSFWTNFGPQINLKINQTFLPKSSYEQVLFQLHLRSNCEDNLMFKQNGRCSKIVPKPCVFCMFFRHPLIPTKANMRHATHSNIIKNHIQHQ